MEINTDGTSRFTFIERASFSNRRADYLTDDEFKALQEKTMNDELFSELLASAEEMVEIENGSITPDPNRVHHFDTLDVKAIRQAANRTQQEFASLIGASFETVRSWEMKRRNPSGTAKKLLILLQENPKEMLKVLEAGEAAELPEPQHSGKDH